MSSWMLQPALVMWRWPWRRWSHRWSLPTSRQAWSTRQVSVVPKLACRTLSAASQMRNGCPLTMSRSTLSLAVSPRTTSSTSTPPSGRPHASCVLVDGTLLSTACRRTIPSSMPSSTWSSDAVIRLTSVATIETSGCTSSTGLVYEWSGLRPFERFSRSNSGLSAAALKVKMPTNYVRCSAMRPMQPRSTSRSKLMETSSRVSATTRSSSVRHVHDFDVRDLNRRERCEDPFCSTQPRARRLPAGR